MIKERYDNVYSINDYVKVVTVFFRLSIMYVFVNATKLNSPEIVKGKIKINKITGNLTKQIMLL